jgi:hypothetical protein
VQHGLPRNLQRIGEGPKWTQEKEKE